MLKIKTLIVTIIILLTLFASVGITAGSQGNSIINNEAKPEIIIRTNKLCYKPGETVTITYANVGDAVAGFVIGTARPVIPWIIEIETDEALYLTDPTLCHPYVMMYGVLEPGERFVVEWDQQYYGYYGDTFYPSEQAPEGIYIVELGYWEVTGEYYPPFMVPGGPPDLFTRTRFFIDGAFSQITTL